MEYQLSLHIRPSHSWPTSWVPRLSRWCRPDKGHRYVAFHFKRLSLLAAIWTE